MNFILKNKIKNLFWRWGEPCFYLLAVLLLTAVLSPIVYYFLLHAWPQPFNRCFDRALLFSALICLLPSLIRGWKNFGLNFAEVRWKYFLGGIGLACLLALLVYLVDITTQKASFENHLNGQDLLRIVLFGFLVAFLEEIFFRGGIQVSLVKRFGRFNGLVLASFFFAATHFIKLPTELNKAELTYLSGLRALGELLFNGSQLHAASSFPFWNLFLIGLATGILFLISKSLWLPIGFHYGLVISLKLSENTLKLDLNSLNLLNQSLTTVVLISLNLILWSLFYPKLKKEPVFYSI